MWEGRARHIETRGTANATTRVKPLRGLQARSPDEEGDPTRDMDAVLSNAAETAKEAARQSGPEQSLGDIRERLGPLLEQENQRTHEGIRERLNEALGRAKPVAREGPTYGKAHEREKDTLRQGPRVRGHGLGWGL